MKDHLSAAAIAFAMSDEEIALAVSVLAEHCERTPLEQAILDEATFRKIHCPIPQDGHELTVLNPAPEAPHPHPSPSSEG